MRSISLKGVELPPSPYIKSRLVVAVAPFKKNTYTQMNKNIQTHCTFFNTLVMSVPLLSAARRSALAFLHESSSEVRSSRPGGGGGGGRGAPDMR